MKVLLVDDSKTVLNFFAGLLNAMGHEGTTFEDAESALESCRSVQYDLALLDWLLPGMSGIDLCQHIRSLPWGNQCVILMITSRNRTGDLNEVLNAGADDYIVKPVKEDLFMTRLRIAERVLRRKREILEANQALKMAKEQLEERVRERTHELEKANELLTDSLQEKHVLLEEVHHRVYNNMAIISSFLELKSILLDDGRTSQILKECRQRIKSMALVHEKLYQSKDFKHIDVDEYIGKLLDDSLQAYWQGEARVKVVREVGDISLNIDKLVPLGLIVNEAFSNSLLHAFEGMDSPEIEISLAAEDQGRLLLVISDNGKGLPEDAHHDREKTLGLRIIDVLVGQIDGNMKVDHNGGTRYSISFPGEVEYA